MQSVLYHTGRALQLQLFQQAKSALIANFQSALYHTGRSLHISTLYQHVKGKISVVLELVISDKVYITIDMLCNLVMVAAQSFLPPPLHWLDI